MTHHEHGVHARMKHSATFHDFLRWQRCAVSWHQRRTGAPAPAPAPNALSFALFDEALLRIPPFMDCWNRALDAPQALASLAQLWLALALPNSDPLSPTPAIDSLVLDEAKRLRVRHPSDAQGEPQEPQTPEALNEVTAAWERFYALPTRLQAARVRQRVASALRWELHALEAAQTRRLPPLTQDQHDELERYRLQPCPLDACLQQVLRHFEETNDREEPAPPETASKKSPEIQQKEVAQP